MLNKQIFRPDELFSEMKSLFQQREVGALPISELRHHLQGDACPFFQNLLVELIKAKAIAVNFSSQTITLLKNSLLVLLLPIFLYLPLNGFTQEIAIIQPDILNLSDHKPMMGYWAFQSKEACLFKTLSGSTVWVLKDGTTFGNFTPDTIQPPSLHQILMDDTPPPFTVIGLKFKDQRAARQWADAAAMTSCFLAGYYGGRAAWAIREHGHSSDGDRYNRLQWASLTFYGLTGAFGGAATIWDNEPGNKWRIPLRIGGLIFGAWVSGQWSYFRDSRK